MMKKLKVTVDGQIFEVEVEPLDAPAQAAADSGRSSGPSQSEAGGSAVPSPLAGKVVEVKVREGDRVAEGDTLLVLEAMKMNTLVSASGSGVVRSVEVAAGDQVEEGQGLVTIG